MGAESQEVINSFWADISSQQDDNSSQISFSRFDIHIDLRIAARFLCWSCFCCFLFICFFSFFSFFSLFALFSSLVRFKVFFRFTSILLKPWIFWPNWSGIAFFDFPRSGDVHCDSFAEKLRVILRIKQVSMWSYLKYFLCMYHVINWCSCILSQFILDERKPSVLFLIFIIRRNFNVDNIPKWYKRSSDNRFISFIS